MSMNRATIIGRVGGEVADREWSDGNGQSTFSVATSKSWRDKQSNEWKEKTQWHSIVVKNKLMRDRAQRLSKGQLVLVEGSIETRQWDKDGVVMRTTEIVVGLFSGQVLSLSKNDSSQQDRPSQDSSQHRSPTSGTRDGKTFYDPTGGRGFGAELDDDIPF
jgi:single-strand DNA-binding protein